MAQKGIIELVIEFQELGKTNKMRVPQSMPVFEVLMDIWKKTSIQKDHGLFMPEDKEKRKKGQWLKPERNLKYYNIQDGDMLIYKKKHSKMKYVLLDGSTKTVRVDLSHTVEKIVERVAKGIGINKKNTYEFGFRSLTDRDGWLVKTLTLHEQGINIDNIPDLLFSRQFFGGTLDDSDDFQLHLFYLDSLDKILHEDLNINRKESTLFAALQLQVTHGDADETKNTPQWLNLSPLLPESWHSEKMIKEDILAEWKKFSGYSQKESKSRYYQLLTTVRYYGFSFYVGFQVMEMVMSAKGKGKRSSTKEKRSTLMVKKTSTGALPGAKTEKTPRGSTRSTLPSSTSSSSSMSTVSYGGKKELKHSVLKEMQKEILEQEKGLGGDLETRPVFFGIGWDGFLLMDENFVMLNKWNATEFREVTQLRATITCTFPESSDPELKLRTVFSDRIAHTIDGYINIRYRLHQDVGTEYSASEEDNLAEVVEIQYDPQTGAAFFFAKPEEGWALNPDGSYLQPQSSQMKVIDLNSARKASAFLADELGTASGFSWVNPQQLSVQDVHVAYQQAKAGFSTKFDELLGTARMNRQLARSQIDPLCSELYNSVQQLSMRAQSMAAFENRGKTPQILGAQAIAEALTKMFVLVENVLEDPDYPDLECCLDQCEKAVRRAQLLLEQESSLIPMCDNGSTLLLIKCADEIDLNMTDLLTAADKMTNEVSGQSKQQLEADLQKVAVAQQWIIPTLKSLAPVLLDERVRHEVSLLHSELGILVNSVLSTTKKFGNPNSRNHPAIVTAAKGVTNALTHLITAMSTAEPELSQTMDFATPSMVMQEALSNVKRVIYQPQNVSVPPSLINVPSIVEAEKLFIFFDAEINDGKGKPTSDVAQCLEKLQSLINDIAHPARAIQPDELSKQLRMCEKAADSIYQVVAPLSTLIRHPELAKVAAQLKSEIETMQKIASNYVSVQDSAGLVNCLARVEACLYTLNEMSLESAALIDLRLNAKMVAARALNLVDEANRGALLVEDGKTRAELQKQSEEVSKGLNDFMETLKQASSAPQEHIKQMELLAEARKQAPKIGALVNAAKTAGRYIEDLNKKQDLFDNATKLKDSLIILMDTMRTVDKVTGQSSIEAALTNFDGITADLDTAQFAAINGLLKPIPGQTRENALQLLTRATKTLVRATNGLTAAAKAGGKLPEHITGCADGISQVSAAVRSVASTIDDKDTQAKVVCAGKAVNVEMLGVIDECRQLAIDRANVQKQKNLGRALLKWKGALTALLETPKDLAEKDIKEARSLIAEGQKQLSETSTKKPVKGKEGDLQEASQVLVSATKVLATAVSQLSTMVLTNPLTLGSGAKVLGEASKQVAIACTNLVAATDSEEGKKEFLTIAQQLLEQTNQVLDFGKVATLTKTKQALDEFKVKEVQVKEGITNLLQALGTFMSQESVESLKTIGSLIARLDAVVAVDAPLNRAQILEKSVEASQALIRVGGNLTRVAASEGAPKMISMNAKEAVAGIETLVLCVHAASAIANSKKDEFLKPVVAQELKEKTGKVAQSMVAQIRAVTAVSVDENEVTTDELIKCNNSLNIAVQQLLESVAALNPATRRCETAGKAVQQAVSDLDAALLTIAGGGKLTLPASTATTLGATQKETTKLCKVVAENVQNCSEHVGAGNVDGVAACAASIETNVPQLIRFVLATAALSDSEFQADLLETAKSLAECLASLLSSLRGANVHDKKSVEKVMADKQAINDAIGRLLNSLQSGAQLISDLEEVSLNIDQNLAQLSFDPPVKSTRPYLALREDLQTLTKELLEETRKLVVLDMSNKGEVGFMAQRIGELVAKTITISNEVISVTKDEKSKQVIHATTGKLIQELKKMINLTSDIAKGQDKNAELNGNFKMVNLYTNQLLSAVKAADVGEILLDQAIKNINAVVQQLSTTALFAQAGQFEVDQAAIANLTVKQLQDQLTVTIKKIETTTQQQLANINKSGGTDEDFGKLALSFGDLLKTLSVQVAQNASKFSDTDSKQKILVTAKDVSSCVIQVLPVARQVHANPNDVTKQMELVSGCNTVVARLGTVSDVLNSAGAGLVKGEKALSASIKKIDAFIKTPENAGSTTPQEMIKAARDVMSATSELTFALSQDELIAAAKKAHISIKDLISRSKAADIIWKDSGAGLNVLNASKNTASAMIKLLEASKLSKTEENQKKVENASDAVGSSLDKFVVALRMIPGCENMSLDEDNIDFEEKAESELKKCASIIEEAANALLQIRPRRKIGGEITKEDINQSILSAAGAIAGATKDLIMSAEVAQSERKQDAKNKGTKFHVDPAWANGLISAAHQVAGAVKTLVGAANASVEGKAQQEALVASSHQVAQATAHLVAASRAKSDPLSKPILRLGIAAKDVANATSQVVEAAAKAARWEEEEAEKEEGNKVDFDSATGKVKEMEFQMKILKLEADLEKERRVLARMRQDRYRKAQTKK